MTPLVPVVNEYYYKRDDLDDPALNASQAVALKLATPAQLAESDPKILWLHSLDQATALNGKQKEHIPDKGRLTTQISGLLFEMLNQAGIKTHYLSPVDETDILVARLTGVGRPS
ncbi:hypothetical protein H7R52_13710 [Weissella confusa]|uniref:SAICAR synthetase/ADE2 N-terminal domain-containing protein n=1 Tax=Weissella confusa TaxID=1583 RepID=A0A923NF19_WEICO|nr:hypothetical protein [Weissella confusa]